MNRLSIFTLLMCSIYYSCKHDHPTDHNTSGPTIENTQPIEDIIPEVNTDRNDERMSWQKPLEVIKQLGPLENKVIADLGAGIGYFSFKILPKAKKTIAIDIDKDKIQILNAFKQTLPKNLKERFDIRQATEDNPNLIEAEADIVLIVNTIAYLTPRVHYLRNIKKYLKEDGEIFIVDYKNKRMPSFVNPPVMEERLYLNILEDQLEAAGFTEIITDDTTLEYQYMVSAKVK